ncbi:XRE family transcriptional regulator [Candidatus Latescibacterota bacterium]
MSSYNITEEYYMAITKSPDINKRIPKLRSALNLTQLQLAKLLGTTQSNLSKIEKGEHALGSVYLSLLETKLNVNMKWLLHGKKPIFLEKTDQKVFLIPIISDIPAGPWGEWIDSYIQEISDSYVAIPQDLRGKRLIAIRIDDDSMEPLLHKSEILIIDLHKKIRDGLAVVRHHWGHKIRNVYKKSRRKYYLYPQNSKYKVEEITADNDTHFYVPVKVISVRDV